MRTFCALGICLFLLTPVVSRAQQAQPQQGKQSTQKTTPATQAPSAKVPSPHPLVITPEEKGRKNPLKFTEESVQKGAKLYTTQCAMCHGKTGNGKGDLAVLMHSNPPDFTNPATLAKRTDGELFTIINKGSGSMPKEGGRLKEDQAWELVNFLRSLEGKTPAKSSGTHSHTARR